MCKLKIPFFISSQIPGIQQPRLRSRDVINAFLGEAGAIRGLLGRMNWWYVTAGIGLLDAVIHLILIQNLDIRYLYAQPLIKGFSVTLPEAMITVTGSGWLGVILEPLWLTLVLEVIAYFVFRISKILKGIGSFHEHLGMVSIHAMIILLGQVTGYIIIGSIGFTGLDDLRDLTPGVGLGLLSWFTVERMGLFYREIVSGFDLFGIWLILSGTSLLQVIDGFNRLKSLIQTLGYFAIYLAFRWFLEGKGCQLWHYLWLSGRI